MDQVYPVTGLKLGQLNPITGFKLGQFNPIGGFELGQFNPITGFKLGQIYPIAGFKLSQFNPIAGFKFLNFLNWVKFIPSLGIYWEFLNPRLVLVAFSQFGKYQSKPINSPFFSLSGNYKKFPVLETTI